VADSVAEFSGCIRGENNLVASKRDREGDEVARKPAGSPITTEIVNALNVGFAEQVLAAQPIDGWHVCNLSLRIGKDVIPLPLV
jgi:hypothetical protein